MVQWSLQILHLTTPFSFRSFSLDGLILSSDELHEDVLGDDGGLPLALEGSSPTPGQHRCHPPKLVLPAPPLIVARSAHDDGR